MADGLDFPVLAKIEHTVDTGTGRYAPGIRMRGTEAVECRPRIRNHLLGHHLVALLVRDQDRISFLVQFCLQVLPAFIEHPVHTIADAGRNIDVLEERKVGQADLEIVRHAVVQPLERLHAQRISQLLFPILDTGLVGLVDKVAVHHLIVL